MWDVGISFKKIGVKIYNANGVEQFAQRKLHCNEDEAVGSFDYAGTYHSRL